MELVIKGKAGEGKSRISHEVAKTLRALGFEVELKGVDEVKTIDPQLAWNSIQAHCPKIVITEVQLPWN